MRGNDVQRVLGKLWERFACKPDGAFEVEGKRAPERGLKLSSVKRRVVRDESRGWLLGWIERKEPRWRALHPCLRDECEHFVPCALDARFPTHVSFGDAVNPCETRVKRALWIQEPVPIAHDHAVRHDRDADRADRARLRVRSLHIDPDDQGENPAPTNARLSSAVPRTPSSTSSM